MGREQTLEGGAAQGGIAAGARQGGGEFTGRGGPEIGGSPEEAPEGEGQSLVPGKGPRGGGAQASLSSPRGSEGFSG